METMVEVNAKKKKIESSHLQVFMTDEYNLFRYKTGNRQVSQSIVNKIYKSIMEYGWIDSSVIIVGDKMVVCDGQHRIAALKKFFNEFGVKHKVHYIVDRKLDDMDKIINWQIARGGWSVYDYAKSWADRGNETYKLYLLFQEKYNLIHSVAQLLCQGDINDGKLLFKKGKMVVNDWGLPKVYAGRLFELRKLFSYAMQEKFVRAIVSFWKHPEFDHNEFTHKLSLDREKLYRVTKADQYRKLIDEIYNYKRREKVKFDFS